MFPSWKNYLRREADQPGCRRNRSTDCKGTGKVSDGNQEFDDVDDAMEDVSKPSEVDQEEDDDPAEEHITMPEETEEDE